MPTPEIYNALKKNWIREDIMKLSGKELPIDRVSSIDLARKVGKSSGVSPSLLLASAFQEGMNHVPTFSEKDYDLKDQYPVDGFNYYGLDTFGQRYDELKKYLPKDFKFRPEKARNEKGEEVISGNFRNNEDALTAKAAMIRAENDRVAAYAKKNNIPLDEKANNYFTMAAYNGGFGNAKIMMDEYSNAKDKQAFIDTGLTSRKGVHKNILPRMENIDQVNILMRPKPRIDIPFPERVPGADRGAALFESLSQMGVGNK